MKDVINAIVRAWSSFISGIIFRAKRVKEEAKDVSDALSDVKEQVKDIGSAIKGEKRKGRPKKK
tara:strand:+ start:1130 stop:1321 length:192 start_codon:yes stop_codon:yes gene_type:complete